MLLKLNTDRRECLLKVRRLITSQVRPVLVKEVSYNSFYNSDVFQQQSFNFKVFMT